MSDIYKIFGNARFAFRSDTLANWEAWEKASEDNILLSGEIAVVTDGTETEKVKIGDGKTPWSKLPWWKGPQGEQGPQGIQGIQGVKGNKGDKGDSADLSGAAPSITNTIIGGEKSLTVTDISPIAHKCSLRLTSDRYESRNVYKFDNVDFTNEHENSNATFTLNENGTFIIAGSIWADTPSRFSIYVDATKLTLNESYMYSLRDNDNNFLSPYSAVTIYKDGSVNEDSGDAKYQITPTEDIGSYCFMYAIIGDKLSDDQLMSYINKTFYPQLEAGTTVTEWQEYGGVSYIEDFSTVTVNVNSTEYTPNAD